MCSISHSFIYRSVSFLLLSNNFFCHLCLLTSGQESLDLFVYLISLRGMHLCRIYGQKISGSTGLRTTTIIPASKEAFRFRRCRQIIDFHSQTSREIFPNSGLVEMKLSILNFCSSRGSSDASYLLYIYIYKVMRTNQEIR